MATSAATLFLKQSGESLNGNGSGNWQESNVNAVVGRIKEAYDAKESLGIDGLVIVPGAGNLARGANLGQLLGPEADRVGRLGTVMNGIVISQSLKRANIAHKLLLATPMKIVDKNQDVIESYDPNKLKVALQSGQVVVIAGGTGEDFKTTDNAVVAYAEDYINHFPGEAIVLKGTKFDGVFTEDPAKSDTLPPRYKKISAATMRQDYERFKAVDRESLDSIIRSGLTMLVYDESAHTLLEVLRTRNDPTSTIGTLVVPQAVEPELY